MVTLNTQTPAIKLAMLSASLFSYFLFSCLLFSGLSGFSGKAEAQLLKPKHFGVVNYAAVLAAAPLLKELREETQKALQEAQKSWLKQEAEIKELAKEYTDNESKWDAKTLETKLQNIQTKMTTLQQETQAFQTEAQKKEADATAVVVDEIIAVVKKLSKEQKLFMVFEVSTSGIIYMEDYVDLTEEVIKEMAK